MFLAARSLECCGTRYWPAYASQVGRIGLLRPFLLQDEICFSVFDWGLSPRNYTRIQYSSSTMRNFTRQKEGRMACVSTAFVALAAVCWEFSGGIGGVLMADGQDAFVVSFYRVAIGLMFVLVCLLLARAGADWQSADYGSGLWLPFRQIFATSKMAAQIVDRMRYCLICQPHIRHAPPSFPFL
jgi:hypothetical protein